MKFKIDILIDPLILECELETKKVKLTDNWLEIIDKIKLLESQCISHHSMTTFEFNTEQFDVLKIKLNDLSAQVDTYLAEYQNDTSTINCNNQLVNDNLAIANLTDIINRIQFNLDKSLFLNKTIVFLERDAHLDKEDYLARMDPALTVGKLLVISNIYFSLDEINEAFRYLIKSISNLEIIFLFIYFIQV